MKGIAVLLVGVLALAGCATAATGGGADSHPRTSPTLRQPAAPTIGQPAQAAAAALAFAAHSDPELGVVDGYATLPPAVQRGEQPIDLVRGHATPCDQPPRRPFTPAERAAIQAAFRGRTVRFVGDPAAHAQQPGALLLAVSPPILRGRHGTVMVIRCVPHAQHHLVTVSWDGHAWQALATG
jgi:hypothetical protein